MLSRILWLLTPFQWILQRLGRAEPKITSEHVDIIEHLIQDGDLITVHEDQRLTSAFIDGEYDHVGLYIGNRQVVEAVGDDWIYSNKPNNTFIFLLLLFVDLFRSNKILKKIKNKGGVRIVRLDEFLYLMDKVAIVRPYYRAVGLGARVAKRHVNYKNLNYDYQFDKVDKSKMYCSELVYHCWHDEVNEFLKDLKHDQILPQDIRDMVEYDSEHKLIFEFKGE